MMQANDNMRPRTAGSRPKSANKSWQSGGGNANSGNNFLIHSFLSFLLSVKNN